MFKDYSGSFIMISSRNKIRSSQRKSSPAAKKLLPATRLMWKTLGAMLLVTLVIGVSSTLWYGLQVQAALDHIGRFKAANNELHIENKLLTAQRDLMLTQEQMQEAAQKIGLRAPSPNQLRYP